MKLRTAALLSFWFSVLASQPGCVLAQVSKDKAVSAGIIEDQFSAKQAEKNNPSKKWLLRQRTLLSSAVALLGTVQTADPAAWADAGALLNYLADLPAQSSNRVISGQFIGHPNSNYAALYDQYVAGLYRQTGYWTSLAGADYARLSEQNDPVDLSLVNASLIQHWNQGGLVTVSWHARNPWTGGSARDKRIGKYSDL